MRQSHGSLALIRHNIEGRLCYLTQWNEAWQAYNFVGGHRENGESFLDCMHRELGEELGLQHADYVFRSQPYHLEYNAFSKSADEETAYTMELFIVDLKPHAIEKVSEDNLNAWVTLEEIRLGVRAGKADGPGRKISETVLLALTLAGLV